MTATIDPQNVLLLFVDIQEKLIAAMPEKLLPNFHKNLKTLTTLAEQLSLSCLITEQYPKGLGPTIKELSLPNTTIIEKLTFSALGEPNFTPALQKFQKKCVLVCGLEAHICVYQTCLDLLSNDYQVFVAVDAVASRKKLHWKTALRSLEQKGCTLTSVETFAFQCLGRAGTSAFKHISKAIR